MGGGNKRFGIWDMSATHFQLYYSSVMDTTVALSFPLCRLKRKMAKWPPGKQTVQINKESLCQCRLHISTAQKETLTFYNSHSNGALFPRCHGEKIPYFFLYRISVTQEMSRKCLSLYCPVLIGFLWKFGLTSRGLASPVVAWHPTSSCPSVRLIKSLSLSWGCYCSHHV